MKVIIPASGIGKRFIEAGYDLPKPLIKVVGEKRIIDYVIDSFSVENDQFIFISGPTTYDALEQHLKTIEGLDYTHLLYEGEKLGPVGTVYGMISEISNLVNFSDEVIVSYCDYGMSWDYSKFLDWLKEVRPAAAIPCYTGYHPHLLHPGNVYACCLCNEDGTVIETVEKYNSPIPLEEDWSAGLYYFSSTHIMFEAFGNQIRYGEKLNGEHYVSLACNFISNDVHTYTGIDKFYQFGTPRDFEEARKFLGFENVKNSGADLDNVVVLAAGKGERFYGLGFTQPKPFLPIGDSDLVSEIEKTFSDMESAEITFVGSSAHKIFWGGRNVKYVPSNTIGAAYSYREAASEINGSTLIVPCDLIARHINPDVQDSMAKYKAIIYTSDPSEFQNQNPNSFSWVEMDEENPGQVKSISLKNRTSDKQKVLIGSFWVSDNSILIEKINQLFESGETVNGEYYLDAAFKNMISEFPVGGYNIPSYYSFGTPSEYFLNRYWYENNNDN